MRIDLSKLPDDAEVTEVYEPEWWHCDEEGEQVLGLEGPLKVRMRINRAGNKYLLDGEMKGGIMIRCDRCQEPYHFDLDSAFHLYLQTTPSSEKGEKEVELLDEDMEVEFIEGEEVDLDVVVREQVFLSLPMKNICKESCRGLCSVCGVNWNRAQCACRKEPAHPAFQKLKALKASDSER
jgi:uncharacterized protein